MRQNLATEEGRELGREIARLVEVEVAKTGRDGRCDTCAGRAGNHLANGSPETLMSFVKCIMERDQFWCHEHDRPCAAWLMCRAAEPVEMPWQHVPGVDAP